MAAKILENSLWMLFGQSFNKLVSFGYLIFLARALGVDNFGYYVAAISFFSLASSIADLGLNQFLIREIAIDRSKLKDYLSSAMVFRLLASMVILTVIGLAMLFLDRDLIRVELIIIGILAVFPQMVALSLDSYYVATQRLAVSAICLVILCLVTATAGFSLIKLNLGALGALMALVIGQVSYVGALLYYLPKTDFKSSFSISRSKMTGMLKMALPYGFLGVLGFLYFRVDSLLLSYLKGPFETGIYGVGYKFLEAVVFVPSAISSALFPVFANLSASNLAASYRLYVKSTVALLGLSLVVMMGYWLVLPMLIELFLPQYRQSISVIKILSLCVPLMFMISPQALIMMSIRRFLRPLLWMSVFNLGLNVVLNLIFIPKFGYIASAWISVLSDAIGFLLFLIFIQYQYRRSQVSNE